MFTQIDKKAGGDAVPMRCVQDARFAYIFNAWSDREHYYRNNNEGMTMKAMNEAAANDPLIARRVQMFRYRAPEQLKAVLEQVYGRPAKKRPKRSRKGQGGVREQE